MRAVFEVLGITDIVAKSHGSSNPTTWCAPRSTLRNAPRPPKWRPSAASRSKTSCRLGSRNDNTEQENRQGSSWSQPDRRKESHRATVRGLGLRKLNSVSELQDTPAVRGMINKIDYLVKIV